MFLLHKKILFKYKSLLKVLSFNISALHQSIWNIRNILRFIFLYLLKKNFFNYFVFYYKFLLFFHYIKNKNMKWLSLKNELSYYFFYNFFLLIKKNYIYRILFFRWNMSMFFFNSKCKWFKNDLFLYYNFYNLYKNYLFFIYIWLYSIKLFYFFSLNCSHLPKKKHVFVILRSPHKDKKSREKFKIQKLKKNVLLPTFIWNNFIFSSIIDESILMKWNIHIKKV